jgi:hypothetical protein
MTYKVIQPPFTLKFRQMSKKELTDYFQWFLGIMPDRINELSRAVRLTPGFEAWRPDKTPASLDALGHWLADHVETRQRTEEELRELNEKINGGSPYPIDISGKELTNKTFSLAMDTGMYLSQVFLQNHPLLRWTQEFGNKQYVDYGQPVLVEFNCGPLNPVWIMVTLASGLADKTRDGRRLRELYDYWENQIHSKA